MRSSLLLLVVVAFALAPSPARAQAPELTPTLAVERFATGSSKITQAERDDLGAVVKWAKAHPWRLIFVEGYADSVGGLETNMTLSQDRADAIRDALVALGLEPRRIVSVAYGRQDSRRVDVRGTRDDFHDLIAAQRPAAP